MSYGILTLDLLSIQYNCFVTSTDKRSEHYRYAAFRAYLASNKQLTDTGLANYLELAVTEIDSTMGGAAAKDLLVKTALTDAQFGHVCDRLSKFPGDWTGQVIRRHQLLRLLSTSDVNEALFEKCLHEGDSIVQAKLLEIANPNQLQLLASSGVSKRIRNMATQKMQHK